MTLIIAFLLGGGILLLVSAIENKSIVETFTQIMRGEKLNLTGTSTGTNTGTQTAPAPDKITLA